ncbi:MAG: glycosyltransferase family 4 protein, partial [Myxococcota bacterium]
SVLPLVEAARPDVIHSFDLAFYPSLALLGHLARRLGVPLVAHFHGGAPARRPGYRAVARHALARTDRALFTTRARGREWVRAGLLDDARIAEVVETSTFFRARDRDAARARTGLHGDPLYVCAGRLAPVKDPLTTLDGFARIARVRPGARLVLTWNDAPLLAEVRRRVAGDPVLASRVDLRGPVPHAAMEDLLASADHLLQSSVREVCGVVVLEALACGVVPVLTDIPPFRRLTDDGRVGRLFPVGDPVALAAQALALAEAPPDERRAMRRDAAAHFDRALAFPALGAELERIYEDLLGARG